MVEGKEQARLIDRPPIRRFHKSFPAEFENGSPGPREGRRYTSSASFTSRCLSHGLLVSPRIRDVVKNLLAAETVLQAHYRSFAP